MTDRVYPSAKQNGTAANTVAANGAAPAAATAAGNQLKQPRVYIPNRQITHLRHDRRRCSGRRCFCLSCFWAVLIICIVLLLAAIAGAIFYVLFRPQRPEFSVSSLKISRFNLTTAASDDTTRLTAKLNLTISAKNPNKKMIYTYDRISLTAIAAGITIANGSFPGFSSNTNNITMIHSTLSSISKVLDADSVSELKSDLKKKRGLPIKILMDTMVMAKQDKLKTKKIGIRVTCEGIHSQTPKGKTAAMATTSDASCKVDLRIKIWKWTF